MVTTLTIKCPHCDQVSQVYLSTTVYVIILNCPSCLSPIMYFRKKIFLLDPKQLKKITCSARNSMVAKLLDQIVGAEPAASCQAKKTALFRHCAAAAAPAVPHAAVEHSAGERYISDDDCTNLRIELELCGDSKVFIDRL